MTFARLIELAQFGSAMDKGSTNEEYIDIHDFARRFYKLAYVELDYINVEVVDIVKRIMEEAKKACENCQEFNCDECVYKEYRKCHYYV